MRRLLLISAAVMGLSMPALADGNGPPYDHLYLCRSPLLAHDFIGSVEEVANDGVAITDSVADQICNHMRAGSDPQCIRAEAKHFEAYGSGWDGMLEITDGTTKIWFHNPDSSGWISPDYYFHHQASLNAQKGN